METTIASYNFVAVVTSKLNERVIAFDDRVVRLSGIADYGSDGTVFYHQGRTHGKLVSNTSLPARQCPL